MTKTKENGALNCIPGESVVSRGDRIRRGLFQSKGNDSFFLVLDDLYKTYLRLKKRLL